MLSSSHPASQTGAPQLTVNLWEMQTHRPNVAANCNLKSAHVEMTGGSLTRLYYVENCDQQLLF